MPKKSETKSIPVGLRFTPSIKAALDKAAEEDRRPVASLVEKILVEWLSKHGFMK
jgi:hypothetical protein